MSAEFFIWRQVFEVGPFDQYTVDLDTTRGHLCFVAGNRLKNHHMVNEILAALLNQNHLRNEFTGLLGKALRPNNGY